MHCNSAISATYQQSNIESLFVTPAQKVIQHEVEIKTTLNNNLNYLNANHNSGGKTQLNFELI